MKPEIKKNWLILGVLIALGCTPANKNNDTHKVRIPIDDGSGHYALQTVELKTVTDMNTLSGTVVELRTGGRFQIDDVEGGKKRLLGYDLGTTPTAHFVNIDGVLRPSDFDTLAMASVAYQFENIKSFFDVLDGNNGIRFPRMILVDVAVAELQGSIAKESIDNASYESHLDMFWLNPFKSADIPIAMNAGVLAHEYFHSVFFKKLHAWQEKLNKKELPGIDVPENGKGSGHVTLNEWSKAAGEEDGPVAVVPLPEVGECGLAKKDGKPLFGPEDYRKLNTFIFASLNEGVADYFGYEYSRNPRWIEASLPSQMYRDLDLGKKFDFSLEDQKCRLYMSMKQAGRRDIPTDPHLIGSYFAHLLYLTSKEWGSLETQKAVMDFIERFSESFLRNFDSHYLSVGEVVRMFFEKRKPEGVLCDKVHDIFGSELNEFSFDCRRSDDPPPPGAASGPGSPVGTGTAEPPALPTVPQPGGPFGIEPSGGS